MAYAPGQWLSQNNKVPVLVSCDDCGAEYCDRYVNAYNILVSHGRHVCRPCRDAMYKVSLKEFLRRRLVDTPKGCWMWTSHIMPQGYGRFWRNGKSILAHRAVYTELVGPIPDGLTLDHLCRNRSCCNPSHLEPVSPAVNTSRGRKVHSEKTHCPYGHEYNEENTYWYLSATGKWWRQCHICMYARCRKARAKKRQEKENGASRDHPV